MIPNKIRRQLQQVDWDFSEHLPGTSKTIHWYPGTFPADIPTTIIQALSKPGDIVFDPYGGTGTTALEAIRQGRRACITEANPIGCLASYVAGGALLLKAIRPDLPKVLCEQIRQILWRIDKSERYQFSLAADSDLEKPIDDLLDDLVFPRPVDFLALFAGKPEYKHLGDWLEKTTLRDVRGLLAEFSAPDHGAFVKLLGKTMVSAILRPASSQTQSWGHIADNVWPKEFVRKETFRLAHQWLSRFESIIDRTDVAPLRGAGANIQFWVALHNWSNSNLPQGFSDIRAKLLITSPPYAGAIDYTLAQRLSLYAFGFDERDLGEFWRAEFGARRKRNLPDSLGRWAQELSSALECQLQVMDISSFTSFVLPHKDAGRDLGAQVMEASMSGWHWEKLIEVDRSIRQMRARQSWTSIKRETIHVFGR
jgi:hypothetical protein